MVRIISGGKCAVSEREICLKVEKNKIWAERADQTHVNNLPICFNAWQTSNVWRQNTSCLSPYKNMFILSRVHAQMQPTVSDFERNNCGQQKNSTNWLNTPLLTSLKPIAISLLRFPAVVAAQGVAEIFGVQQKGSWENFKSTQAHGRARLNEKGSAFVVFNLPMTSCIVTAAENPNK